MTPDLVRSLLTLTILAACLSIFLAAISLTRNRTLPPPLQALVNGKMHYLGAGVLLGLGFSLDAEGTRLMQHTQVSMVGLLITWMGLDLGLRTEFRRLKGVTPRLLVFDVTQGLVTFALTAVIALFFLPRFSASLLEGADPLVLTSFLSVAASITAPWNRADSDPPHSGEGELEGRVPPQVLGNVPGILILGAISTLFFPHPPIPLAGRLFPAGLDSLFLSLFVGVGLGILLDMVFRVEPSLRRAACLAVAIVVASGGLCLALGLPALFCGFLAGAWAINATLRRKDLQVLCERVGAVSDGLFMFVAGSIIGVRSWDSPLNIQGMVYLALLLFLSRAIAKTVGVGLLWRLLRPSGADRESVGMWQLSQGSLAVAVCIQPLFVPTGSPMQVVTILSGAALAVALSQAAASTFHVAGVRPLPEPDEQEPVPR